jgi:hypothetical protein
MATAVQRPKLAEALQDWDPELGKAEVLRFRKMTLRVAIEKAAGSRKENGHPYEHQQKNWNFWPEAIEAAVRILSDAEPRFRKCADFDEIHGLVKELLEDAHPATHGLGVLYFYDVAFRIGACRGDAFLPKKVYLHAGTLEGAKRLLPNKALKAGDALDVSELPKALDHLKPWAVEDFLCYYAKRCRQG